MGRRNGCGGFFSFSWQRHMSRSDITAFTAATDLLTASGSSFIVLRGRRSTPCLLPFPSDLLPNSQCRQVFTQDSLMDQPVDFCSLLSG